MILVALLLAQQEELPAYADSIRCAGLAEAADQLEADEARSRPLYDAALYWGLAASERARKDGIASATFKADQLRARETALKQLKSGDADAAGAAIQCVMKVPQR